MKIAVDTNLLVRAVMNDHPVQSTAAKRAMAEASVVFVSLAALCEFVWVLQSVYQLPASKVAMSIRILLNAENVVADSASVEAGLQMLEKGADFADGVIAQTGFDQGAEQFLTFDRKALRSLKALGMTALAPS